MSAPVISKPELHVLILDPKGEMLMQCVIGPDDSDPETQTLFVNVRPGMRPEQVMPIVKTVGQCFLSTSQAAENNGVPCDPETGAPIQ